MEEERKELVKQVRKLLARSRLSGVRIDGEPLVLPGGSDRRFYRFQGEATFIAMVAPTRAEVKEYMQIQEHLLERGIAVPEIYALSEKEKMVLMEDIGTRSLQKTIGEVNRTRDIEELYGKVLRTLVHLQISGMEGIERCKPVIERVFDYDALRWESNYFRESFLEALCKCPPEETKRLDGDFEKLARSLTDEPRYFMHRDFQSTNIFIKAEQVRIIDFQSAHQGVLSYDLAALLRDAYVDLPLKMRKSLFHGYYTLLKERTDAYENEKDFRKAFVLSAIQRNMQALGAFSFLSSVKKKQWFLKFIPRAISYLQEGLDEAGEFDSIQNMIGSERISECVQSMSS